MNIQTYGNTQSDLILIQAVDEHDLSQIEKQIAYIKDRTDRDFLLYTCQIDSWNDDLSPWQAEAVFGDQPFGSQAKDTLSFIDESIIQKHPDKKIILGGYSLAGLFALWAAYQTDSFAAVAAASPSVWFPHFLEYAKENEILTDAVYLSLGDKEARTRNPVMSSVADNIQSLYEHYQSIDSMDTILEWNQGNHFVDSDIRMAKAFVWSVDHTDQKLS